ncbi:pyrimidine reductase family protein [Gordonia sp. VNQ95]|jgi:5-amino-6-(5-phosphoribosylamino)uracil reductase|uniref:pyrimidine reductase family protein n=1 Tax=Gordonia TaxID=2053 RepID=UPI0032B3DB51
MLYQHKATQVTSDELDDAARLRVLSNHYPYPDDLTRPVVRANMVASIDGASSVDGKSGGLGSDIDRAIFRTLRGLADVVVVGAGTATAENYHQPEPDEAFAAARSDLGQSPAPELVLISNSLSIRPDYPPLSHAATTVLTCADSPADRRRALMDAGATLVDCGTEKVEFGRVLAHLAERGLLRVLCEGGPSLLGSIIADDLLDELCLTISPTLAAGDAARIAHGPAPVDTPPTMRPHHILGDDDGFLYTRWTRAN